MTQASRQASTQASTQSRTGLVAFAFSIIGLGISTYLTIEHYTGNTTLACSSNATVNCEKVTTSQWSHIGGVPVAVFGLVFFVAMTVLTVPALWRVGQLDLLRLVGAVAGVVSVLYLVWVELFRVNAICLWCTGVHICTVVLFGLIAWAYSERASAR